MSKVALRGLFRHSLFRKLLAVRVVGQLQDGLIQSALAGFILFSPESQDSPAAVVGTFALILLPYSVIGPFIGVFLDRWRRRQVLLVANLVRAALVVGLLITTALGWPTVVLGVLVLFVLGTNRLILTALATSLPRTVPEEHLVGANAVAPVAGTTAAAVGAAASISLGSRLGATTTVTAVLLGLAAAGLVITALLSLRISVTALGPESNESRETWSEVLRQLRNGARTLWSNRTAWWAVSGVTSHRMAYGIGILLAIVASKTVLSESNSEALGAVGIAIAAAGVGALLGAVITPPIVRWWEHGRWSMVISVIAAVAVPLALLQVSTVGFAAAGFFLGLAGQSVKIATDAVIGLTVGDELRGRVFSLFDVAINMALLLGIAVAGLLIGDSGQSAPLSATTGVLLAAAAFMFAASSRQRVH